MAETPEEIAYAESVRAIAQQSSQLDELRSRTGLLLTGASVATSFLGAEALSRDGELGTLGGLAVLAFLAVVGLCLWIVVPRRKAWRLVLGAKVLLEDWADEPRCGDANAMKRFVATTLEENYDLNEALLDRLYRVFSLGAGALGAEVLLWTMKLA
ncbi:MAG TPA: hypothetical protein VF712_12535 [Thermoleophilaceae bacterium]